MLATSHNDFAWCVVRRTDAKATEYAAALKEAQAATELLPEGGNCLNTLGAAQYRVGDYKQSLATLTRSAELNAKQLDLEHPHPLDLVFLAMVHHRLGDETKAREHFSRLQEILKQERWKNDSEIKPLLREAEKLIAPNPPPEPTP